MPSGILFKTWVAANPPVDVSEDTVTFVMLDEAGNNARVTLSDLLAVLAYSAPTVDTDQLFRIILFSDGRVRAIPIAEVDPDTPTGLVATPRISSVTLTWNAAAGASTYRVYRDGAYIATTTGRKYRDSTVMVSSTYEYTVQAVSAYELRSDQSAGVDAYIDPALNVTPTVEIRSFPQTSIALDNRAVIRVNAFDPDGQALTLALLSDIGTLTPTADPSVWYLDPA